MTQAHTCSHCGDSVPFECDCEKRRERQWMLENSEHAKEMERLLTEFGFKPTPEVQG